MLHCLSKSLVFALKCRCIYINFSNQFIHISPCHISPTPHAIVSLSLKSSVKALSSSLSTQGLPLRIRPNPILLKLPKIHDKPQRVASRREREKCATTKHKGAQTDKAEGLSCYPATVSARALCNKAKR